MPLIELQSVCLSCLDAINSTNILTFICLSKLSIYSDLNCTLSAFLRDLSRTSITNLPTSGLKNIKELYLRETKSLRQFPSILTFEKITKAELYYPHHCCAFKIPEKQSPAKWRVYEEEQKRIRQECATHASVSPSSTASPASFPIKHGWGGINGAPVLLPEVDTSKHTRDGHSAIGIGTVPLPPDEPMNLFKGGWNDGFGPIIPHDARPHELEDTHFKELSKQNIKMIPNPNSNKQYMQQSVASRAGFENIVFPNGSKNDNSDLHHHGLFINGDILHTHAHPNNNPNSETWGSATVSVDESVTALCGDLFRDINFRSVNCTPHPDAFNPCEDVMGYEWLRIIVWIVLLAAIFGNIMVFVVYVSSHRKMNVTKFLMCNLAFADFLMGIYLLLLASIDIHTLGEYFNYAILWQNKGGCQAAGFLTVFSCELSIFTLTVITFERWYAINYAIHLNKRLRLRQAIAIMTFGWIYAIIMANLPLIGISGYGNVSICLPMKVENIADQIYVVSLLVINGIAFVCICICYINMYFQVRQSDSTARSNDATIAKRMAMLVFTNFVCWAPIAFFGLTASAGLPLINITDSKILLVFFYPLNSCANPFLYVIITKQFRKEMMVFFGKYGFCTKKANKYKLTVDSKSHSHSRKDSLALHNIIHPVSTTISRFSFSSSTSKGSLKHDSFSCSKVLGKTTCCESSDHEYSATKRKTSIEPQEASEHLLERKLSIVEENNSYISAMDVNNSIRFADDVESPYRSVRSASEYVTCYSPGKSVTEDKVVKVPQYVYQCSTDTSLSSQSGNTENTCVSDHVTLENILEGGELFQQGHLFVDEIFYPIVEETDERFPSNVSNISLENGHKRMPSDEREHENECDHGECDDCVQQTLLKHSTLRDSPPVSQISENIFIETKYVTFRHIESTGSVIENTEETRQ